MKIEWNKVTWYSKLFAVAVFVATFWFGFWLGAEYETVLYGQNDVTELLTSPVSMPAKSIGNGARCGGFIRNAPICLSEYHCDFTGRMPDTGGVCVPNKK